MFTGCMRALAWKDNWCSNKKGLGGHYWRNRASSRKFWANCKRQGDGSFNGQLWDTRRLTQPTTVGATTVLTSWNHSSWQCCHESITKATTWEHAEVNSHYGKTPTAHLWLWIGWKAAHHGLLVIVFTATKILLASISSFETENISNSSSKAFKCTNITLIFYVHKIIAT